MLQWTFNKYFISFIKWHFYVKLIERYIFIGLFGFHQHKIILTLQYALVERPSHRNAIKFTNLFKLILKIKFREMDYSREIAVKAENTLNASKSSS